MAAGRPLLVIAGFMATGKTSVGRAVARLLDLPFFDLDEVIERRAGLPISEIFRKHGEAGFRRLERDAVRDASTLSAAVVATGGGAPLDQASFSELSNGAVVALLTANPEVIEERVSDPRERPLLREGRVDERIRTLLEERSAAYRAAGDGALATLAVDTSDRTARDAAGELAAAYERIVANPRRGRVVVRGPTHPYDVVVGEGILSSLGKEVASAVPAARAAAVVADPAVASIADHIGSQLSEQGLRVSCFLLPPGERAKDLLSLGELWRGFRRDRIERSDVVVAVGGGATLDVAGFAAATYARGIALANVPTTLLAMADAAVGGKAAVDHDGVKNLAGAFHHPVLVAADPATLSTLPERARRSGFAEIVKAGVLASPLLVEALETNVDPSWAIEQAVRIKAGFVAADPFDRDLRHALNLGHTFGHALESASDYRTSHGEAVGVGMIAAARLGERHGVTPVGRVELIRSALHRLGLPTEVPASLNDENLRDAFAGDKKRRGGEATFVVPAHRGAELLCGVPLDEALACLPRTGS